MISLEIFTFTLLLVGVPDVTARAAPSSIVLVPGDGGSRIYQEIDCYLFKFNDLVWVNYVYMLFPCLFTSRMKLQYDPKTHKTSNWNNNTILVPGWGSTEMIEELDQWRHPSTTYFYNFVNSLVKDKFYVRNKTVRGAPYDFRRAPNENTEFFVNLEELIEETYKLSGNRRVVLLGHSLGSLYSLYFLKLMTNSWKKKYLRAFISASSPLGGSMKAVKLQTSGTSLGSPRKSIMFRKMQRSFPTSAFLMIRPEIFGNEPIVITPKRNYSASDYEAFFADMSYPDGFMMYEDTKNLVNGFETPEGVDEIYCIYSNGLPTIRQIKLESFPNGEPSLIYGDGDGTVNIKSLQICKNWKNVHHSTIENVAHMEIVGTQEFIDLVKTILYKKYN